MRKFLTTLNYIATGLLIGFVVSLFDDVLIFVLTLLIVIIGLVSSIIYFQKERKTENRRSAIKHIVIYAIVSALGVGFFILFVVASSGITSVY